MLLEFCKKNNQNLLIFHLKFLQNLSKIKKQYEIEISKRKRSHHPKFAQLRECMALKWLDVARYADLHGY